MRENIVYSDRAPLHGLNLIRAHKHDWLVLVLLLLLLASLSLSDPFHRFISKDMMTNLKYPMQKSTVPTWALPVISILLPATVFAAFYISRRDVYDLHHASLGLLYSVIITGVITNAIKDAVGRPRPDFYWRCFPDGKELYDQVTGCVICHGDKHVIKDGHKSFPSGHTAYCFAGLGYLALYLSGKVQAFDGKGHIAKLCVVFLPFLIATFVGISRIDNYRHHWEDVFVGGLIGSTAAAFCYLQTSPPPHHEEGWGPYTSLETLSLLQSSPHLPEPCDEDVPLYSV